MSENAQTLIKASLRLIGSIAPGETPTDDELADGLEALKFMLRSWSGLNIRLYYTEQDTVALTGALSYTIGSGGTCNTVRPSSIRGGYVVGSGSVSHIITMIDEDLYRRLKVIDPGGGVDYVWYSPEYPLGVINVYPSGSGTLYLDSLKPLTEPTILTSTISFPPEYDELIKYCLAVRLAPEYGKSLGPEVTSMAEGLMRNLESRNFNAQINAARLELLKMSGRFNIDEG